MRGVEQGAGLHRLWRGRRTTQGTKYVNKVLVTFFFFSNGELKKNKKFKRNTCKEMMEKCGYFNG